MWFHVHFLCRWYHRRIVCRRKINIKRTSMSKQTVLILKENWRCKTGHRIGAKGNQVTLYFHEIFKQTEIKTTQFCTNEKGLNKGPHRKQFSKVMSEKCWDKNRSESTLSVSGCEFVFFCKSVHRRKKKCLKEKELTHWRQQFKVGVGGWRIPFTVVMDHHWLYVFVYTVQSTQCTFKWK